MPPLPSSWTSLDQRWPAHQHQERSKTQFPIMPPPSIGSVGKADTRAPPLSNGSVVRGDSAAAPTGPAKTAAPLVPVRGELNGTTERLKRASDGQQKPAWGAPPLPPNAERVAAARALKVGLTIPGQLLGRRCNVQMAARTLRVVIPLRPVSSTA